MFEIGRDKEVIVDEDDLSGRIDYITRILKALDMKKKIKEFGLG